MNPRIEQDLIELADALENGELVPEPAAGRLAVGLINFLEHGGSLDHWMGLRRGKPVFPKRNDSAWIVGHEDQTLMLLARGVDAANSGTGCPEEVAQWLIDGLAQHVGSGEPLEEALGLSAYGDKSRNLRTVYLHRLRDRFVYDAWRALNGDSDALVRAVNDFHETTPVATSADAALANAFGCGVGVPKSKRRLDDIVTRVGQLACNQIACNTLTAKWNNRDVA